MIKERYVSLQQWVSNPLARTGRGSEACVSRVGYVMCTNTIDVWNGGGGIWCAGQI